MAEGMIGGILGDEDEKSEVEAKESLAGAEAFASAVASRLSANDPEVAKRTSVFLAVANQACLAPESRKYVALEPLIEHMMKVAIAEKRRQDRTPRHAAVWLGVLRAIQHPCIQTFADQSHERLVVDPQPEHLH
jgi:hypothetical protein